MLHWRRRRKQGGFTFVELMTVLVILGLLAALLFPRFIRARFKAAQSACVQSEKNIATALESYSVDNDHLYPDTLNKLNLPGAGNSYIQSLPSCASAPESTYSTTYERAPDMRSYTISCPGIHYLQLTGEIRQGFPQYQSSGTLVDR